MTEAFYQPAISLPRCRRSCRRSQGRNHAGRGGNHRPAGHLLCGPSIQPKGEGLLQIRCRFQD
jgi:hypothetical protein